MRESGLQDGLKKDHQPLLAKQLVEDRLKPGDEITLGFDGDKTDDATALVACRIRDRYMWPIGVWEHPRELPQEQAWEVDKDAVNDAVGQAFTNFKVRGFFADVELWETHIDSWAREYGKHLEVKVTGGHLVKWDMRGRLKKRSANTAWFAVFHETPSPSATRDMLKCWHTMPYKAQRSPPQEIFAFDSAARCVSCTHTCLQVTHRYRRTRMARTLGRHPNGAWENRRIRVSRAVPWVPHRWQ